MPIYKILISILLILSVATQASARSANNVFARNYKIKKYCEGQNCPNMADKKQMEAQAQKWLDALPKAGFKVQNTNETAIYKDETSKDGYRTISISTHGGDWSTGLHFSKPVSSAMSVEEIQGRVLAFINQGFPTPGLNHPNWDIRALPPGSRVDENIQILSVGPGYLKFKVHARSFSLYGYDMRKRPIWWDRATPPEVYFSIKKTFWADAEITYKIKNFK